MRLATGVSIAVAFLAAGPASASPKNDCIHDCTTTMLECRRAGGSSSSALCKGNFKICVKRCSVQAAPAPAPVAAPSRSTPAKSSSQPASPKSSPYTPQPTYPQPAYPQPKATAPASPAAPTMIPQPMPAPIYAPTYPPPPPPPQSTPLSAYQAELSFVEEGTAYGIRDEGLQQEETWRSKETERLSRLRQSATAEMERLLTRVCTRPAAGQTGCELRMDDQTLPPPPAVLPREPARRAAPAPSAAGPNPCDGRGASMRRECEQRCQAVQSGAPDCERQCGVREGRYLDCCKDRRLGRDPSACYF